MDFDEARALGPGLTFWEPGVGLTQALKGVRIG
jgi:hypothetical protein